MYGRQGADMSVKGPTCSSKAGSTRRGADMGVKQLRAATVESELTWLSECREARQGADMGDAAPMLTSADSGLKRQHDSAGTSRAAIGGGQQLRRVGIICAPTS